MTSSNRLSRSKGSNVTLITLVVSTCIELQCAKKDKRPNYSISFENKIWRGIPARFSVQFCHYK